MSPQISGPNYINLRTYPPAVKTIFMYPPESRHPPSTMKKFLKYLDCKSQLIKTVVVKIYDRDGDRGARNRDQKI